MISSVIILWCITFELSRPWRQGPLADKGNIPLRPGRPVDLAEAGRLERRVRRHRGTPRNIDVAKSQTNAAIIS